MTSTKQLENAIFWQNYVINNTKDPKQRDRCEKAVIKLQNQIDSINRGNDITNFLNEHFQLIHIK